MHILVKKQLFLQVAKYYQTPIGMYTTLFNWKIPLIAGYFQSISAFFTCLDLILNHI